MPGQILSSAMNRTYRIEISNIDLSQPLDGAIMCVDVWLKRRSNWSALPFYNRQNLKQKELK